MRNIHICLLSGCSASFKADQFILILYENIYQYLIICEYFQTFLLPERHRMQIIAQTMSEFVKSNRYEKAVQQFTHGLTEYLCCGGLCGMKKPQQHRRAKYTYFSIDRTPVEPFDDSFIMLYFKIYRFTGFQNKPYNLLVFIDTSLYLHPLFISGNIHLHLI